ncbi:hypothetical protein BBP40_006377 [Aspergillus hancockii]|nr:hypothetical protein BBP40_006377 [Aspergillus hancockii]
MAHANRLNAALSWAKKAMIIISNLLTWNREAIQGSIRDMGRRTGFLIQLLGDVTVKKRTLTWADIGTVSELDPPGYLLVPYISHDRQGVALRRIPALNAPLPPAASSFVAPSHLPPRPPPAAPVSRGHPIVAFPPGPSRASALPGPSSQPERAMQVSEGIEMREADMDVAKALTTVDSYSVRQRRRSPVRVLMPSTDDSVRRCSPVPRERYGLEQRTANVGDSDLPESIFALQRLRFQTQSKAVGVGQ